ncbi:putative transglycosylase signal peptide protein [Edwardsiella piscicida]|uniref:Membrane-bound lytic murein transglycosylase E n=3 Tax=Edwardsiella TaxID=635 RepID=A0A0H3DSG0_EDWTF|nr:lytic transglycosylase domain-containing protein [Edwardsiella piscicida]ACY83729.1 putative transglycosylase signal peptide protein [Edwardsiella tarda EIB202]ADM40947.1 Membrane-bound lytic murein transglycosylase E [Edwardsiella tarda FL6-60]ARD17483.1 transglycosylase [Edwardsiella piscicida]ELM3658692.1 transglycosylase SLT domain-containing protein [Edwardsiella piscicida]ELM3736640.1 transglycosylase SLT domain-containing protein [Edwardsiella piscicida]
MRKWVLLGLALLAWRCVGAPLKWYRVSGEERVASTLAPPPVISRGAGYASLIGQVAGKHALDPRLIQAVVAVESSYRYDTVSEKGAIGLMQVMPETAARFGHFALLDPRDNLEVGTRYLSTLLRRFNGRLDLALAGYNAGEGAVLRYGGTIPPYPETQRYVQRVLEYYRQLRSTVPAAAVPQTEMVVHTSGGVGNLGQLWRLLTSGSPGSSASSRT